ncbi:MAG TPA: response regulator [Gemmatimonadaceae bacterium]
MRRGRVLVVDDDRRIVETLCEILALHGWEPIAGYDGEAAVVLACKHEVDTVLLDVRMPRMSGVEAWREIREERPNARSVFMTAHDTRDVVTEVGCLGVAGVLRKPLDVAELVAVLDGVERERDESPEECR